MEEKSNYVVDFDNTININGNTYVLVSELGKNKQDGGESIRPRDVIQEFQMNNIDTLSYREALALILGQLKSLSQSCNDCKIRSSCNRFGHLCSTAWFEEYVSKYYRKHEFTGETKLVCDECPFWETCEQNADKVNVLNCRDIIEIWFKEE